MQDLAFEIVKTSAGVVSIRDNAVGEILHNPVGPWAEAQALYIGQSQLEEKLKDFEPSEFILFDVGLGAATNALAALQVAEKSRRKFRIISFEHNLELLKFALENSSCFAHFSGYEEILENLLTKGSWHKNHLSWDLRKGEFLNLIQKEDFIADLIFYDPYSPHRNQEMWTLKCFQMLREKSHHGESRVTSFYTYSQATRIRAALLAAGFFVGIGKGTGLKNHTTEASTSLKNLNEPLGRRWLERFKRSSEAFPFDCKTEDERKVFHSVIEKHPQFQD